MKKKTFYLLLFITMLLNILPTSVSADVGPKPSIEIDFKGLENERYYVTLLSEVPSTGPYYVTDYPNVQSNKNMDVKDETFWQKFSSYQDEDGFYFLQYYKDCTETSKFVWGYRPPPRFKILIYFPEYDCLLVSEEAYKRYALDSYYKVDARGLDIESVGKIGTIKAERVYDYTAESFSLFFRMIATILIEVLIALFFGFREKNQLYIIIAANIITLGLLNVLLNALNFNQNGAMYIFNYVWMELLVCAIEAVTYTIYFPKYSNKKTSNKWHPTLYALTANVMSFDIGLLLAHLMPRMF